MNVLHDAPMPQSPFKEKIKVLWNCFLFMLLIKFVGSLLIAMFKFSHFSGLTDLLKNEINITDSYSIEFSLVLIIIILPIIEEIAFRGWLTDSPLFISISLACFSYFLYVVIIKFAPYTFEMSKSLKKGVAVCLTITTLIILLKNQKTISLFVGNNKTKLIIISILSFSIIHAFNYEIKELKIETLIGLLIILLPYPVVAYILTYIRIRNGLVWSIALHVINNSLILFPVIFGAAKI